MTRCPAVCVIVELIRVSHTVNHVGQRTTEALSVASLTDCGRVSARQQHQSAIWRQTKPPPAPGYFYRAKSWIFNHQDTLLCSQLSPLSFIVAPCKILTFIVKSWSIPVVSECQSWKSICLIKTVDSLPLLHKAKTIQYGCQVTKVCCVDLWY